MKLLIGRWKAFKGQSAKRPAEGNGTHRDRKERRRQRRRFSLLHEFESRSLFGLAMRKASTVPRGKREPRATGSVDQKTRHWHVRCQCRCRVRLGGHLDALILFFIRGSRLGTGAFVVPPSDFAIARLKADVDVRVRFLRRSFKNQCRKIRRHFFENREWKSPCRVKLDKRPRFRLLWGNKHST